MKALDFNFVLFGATGDLAMRKIIPCLYQAFIKDLLPKSGEIIALGRGKFSDQEFIQNLELKSKPYIPNYSPSSWKTFTQAIQIRYFSLDIDNFDDFLILKSHLKESGSTIVYLSIAPKFFSNTCKNLAKVGLNGKNTRIVLEKPLGMDLDSFLSLDRDIGEYYTEEQIYRIDHYLGKESVQNILFMRAHNPILSALWNCNWISGVELSVFETLGVEGRGEFYESTGALRDMLQNHMLQILALLTMPLPQEFSASSIRREKINLLKSIKPLEKDSMRFNVARAQYTSNDNFLGYRDEANVCKSSMTETYVAIRCEIDHALWRGVPFYLRTGKRMMDSFGQIVLNFKSQLNASANTILIRFQPDFNLSLDWKVKQAGWSSEIEVKSLKLDLSSQKPSLLPYEKLILDVINQNPTSFIHKDELEAAWRFVTPILDSFKNNDVPLYFYKANTFGPEEAEALLARDGNKWFNKI